MAGEIERRACTGEVHERDGPVRRAGWRWPTPIRTSRLFVSLHPRETAAQAHRKTQPENEDAFGRLLRPAPMAKPSMDVLALKIYPLLYNQEVSIRKPIAWMGDSRVRLQAAPG